MNIKKIVALLFSLFTAVILLNYSQVQAAYIDSGEQKTSEVVYFDSADSSIAYSSLYIYGVGESPEISNVKSSNKKVVEVSTYYYEDYEEHYVYVGLDCKKPGTAKITLNINGKKYTATIKVVGYSNPIDSLTISDINSGKNLSSSFDTTDTTDLVWTSNFTSKNNTIKIKPAKGWTVSSVYIYESSADYTESRTYTHSYDNISNVTINDINIYGNKSFSLRIYLNNKKNGASRSVCYLVNPYKAA